MQGRGKALAEFQVIITTAVLVILICSLFVSGSQLSLQFYHKNSTVNMYLEKDSQPSLLFPAKTSTNSRNYWYVGASSSDTELALNSGIRSMIQVKPQNVSSVLAFWTSEAMSNNLWAQVGYYINNGSTPVAFYEVWNLTDRSEMAAGINPIDGGIHTFSFVLSEGTDWNFCVDSVIIGSYDMQTNATDQNYPLNAASEEGYAQYPFAFSNVLFASAMQVLRNGTWLNVTDATSFGSAWGIQGTNQGASLSQNQFSVGQSDSVISNGTILWA